MHPRLTQLLQIVALASLAWFAFSLLSRVHWILIAAIWLVAIGNTVSIWLLRYEPRLLLTIYGNSVAKPYLDLLCRITGDQPPVGQAGGPGGELLLNSRRDFDVAAYRARIIVRGHDDVIDELFSRIHEAVALRKRRGLSVQPPLASFLLVGGEGIGKRYLTRVLSKLMFRNSGVIVFNCRDASPELLIGTKASEGELLEAVRRQPHQVVVFEHVESASPEVIRLLSTIMTEHGQRAPNSGRVISFQNAVLVMTTTNAADSLASLAQSSITHGAWHRALLELLSSETQLGDAFLNAFSAVLVCQPPSDLVRAEVVAMLMKKEAKDHGLQLSRVDPEIIVSQVTQIENETGFGLAPERIKKLLRKPLVAATEQNHEKLSLRVRW